MSDDENNIQNLLNYLEKMDNERYKKAVKDVITEAKNLPVVNALIQAEDSEGKPLLDNHNIIMCLYTARRIKKHNPDKILNTLADKEKIKSISTHATGRVAMLWFLVSREEMLGNNHNQGR